MKEIIKIARQYRESHSGPLSCKPNAGIPQIVEEKVIYTETPEDLKREPNNYWSWG